jgi:hypothetical protein
MRNVRYGKHTCSNKEQIAWDMSRLIERFENHEKLSNMTTFKNLKRVFEEQCEILDSKIKIRKHPGGEAMLNPSDPDASIDNKGFGYQVQVSQTYNPENPVQIITAALPQTASESDQTAINPMLKKMETNNAKPKELLADAGYGSDDNVVKAAEDGVELVAPTTGKEYNKVGLEECEFDSENRIIKCPCGKLPLQKKFDGTKGRAVFSLKTCGNCPNVKRCIACKKRNNYVITYDVKRLSLRERRLHEKSDEFRERYRFRSGIEALFGNMKQNTPLRRLSVRGKSAVFSTIYSIMTMYNIMQMVTASKNNPEKAIHSLRMVINFACAYIFYRQVRVFTNPNL